MKRAITATFAAGLLSTALGTGCGGGQTRPANAFQPEWLDDSGKSIAGLQDRFREFPLHKGANVVVGVVPDGLVGARLDANRTWRFQHPVDARPWIAGDVVVGSGAGVLFALDARSGQLLWSRSTSGRLRGAGDDGNTTVAVLEPSDSRGTTLLAVTREGYVMRQLEVDLRLGIPAVAATVAFIPWQNQYVSALDLRSGAEVARVTLRHKTTRAFVLDGSLYFGEVGATRFDEHIGKASRDEASLFRLPDAGLPGNPTWLRSGDRLLDTQADARDRVALYARPEARDVAFNEDRFFGTYYRIVVGLTARNGALAWVRAVDDDVLGGAAYDGGLAVCTRQGNVLMLDAVDGTGEQAVSFGRPLQSCVVQADTLSRRVANSGGRALVEQLSDVIRIDDTQMSSMQQWLLAKLVGNSEALATKKLIELCMDPSAPPVLVEHARLGLSQRRNGAEAMLEALGQRYDYLAGVLQPPPVGPMADALAAMMEVRAAPSLAEHLHEPASTIDDVRRAAQALESLATEAEAPSLRTFFALYRATADSDELVQAVVSVARALMRVGGPEGRHAVSSAAKDPMTVPSLRGPLSKMMSEDQQDQGRASGH